MSAPRVVPGDDGAGVIDRVGPRVPAVRIGQRVWVHSANHGRPFGTSAEFVVVPAEQAIELPANTTFEAGGRPGRSGADRASLLFADGPIAGRTVLVTGRAGAVAHYAIELAKHGGARVLATASTPDKQRAALAAGADTVIDYRKPDAAAEILRAAPCGVDRVVDVAFGANLPLTSAVIARNGTIAGYASDAVPEPSLPFYALMRRGGHPPHRAGLRHAGARAAGRHRPCHPPAGRPGAHPPDRRPLRPRRHRAGPSRGGARRGDRQGRADARFACR